MTVLNRKNKKPVTEGGNTIPSRMSLKEFGDAMAQIDLSSIPPERRPMALRAHVLRIASMTIHDQRLARKMQTRMVAEMRRGAALN